MTDAILMEKLKTRSVHEGIDRISELPEHIIHHIMLFLPRDGRDTTRISILSKKFFSIWCTFPAVDFDFYYEPKSKSIKVWDTDYVLNSIQYRLHHLRLCNNNNNNNNCLLRLRFLACLHGGFESDGNARIVQMVDYALQKQVKELEVMNIEEFEFEPHQNLLVKLSCFPEPVFSAKSITSLWLYGLNLAAAESQAQHITLSCPLIKKFSLRFCSGITSITLRGPKLSLALFQNCYGLQTIQVDGPTTSLGLLEFIGQNHTDINLASSKSVKTLNLVGIQVTDRLLNSCRMVERLSFDGCFFGVKNTRWCFNHLKSLEFVDCQCKLVEFHTPNLECFAYVGMSYGDFPLLISSRRIKEAVIRPFIYYSGLLYIESYLIDFFNLLSRFSQCQCRPLTLSDRRNVEELIYPTTMRAILNPPLHDIEHLRIELAPQLFDFSNMVAVIDSLLWLFPHPNTIYFIDSYSGAVLKSIKFNYRDATGCCGSIDDAKCWPQHLKEIILHKFKDIVECANLQTYFFNTYNISPLMSD